MIVNKVKNNLLFKTMNLFVHNFKKYGRRNNSSRVITMLFF